MAEERWVGGRVGEVLAGLDLGAGDHNDGVNRGGGGREEEL